MSAREGRASSPVLDQTTYSRGRRGGPHHDPTAAAAYAVRGSALFGEDAEEEAGDDDVGDADARRRATSSLPPVGPPSGTSSVLQLGMAPKKTPPCICFCPTSLSS